MREEVQAEVRGRDLRHRPPEDGHPHAPKRCGTRSRIPSPRSSTRSSRRSTRRRPELVGGHHGPRHRPRRRRRAPARARRAPAPRDAHADAPRGVARSPASRSAPAAASRSSRSSTARSARARGRHSAATTACSADNSAAASPTLTRSCPAKGQCAWRRSVIRLSGPARPRTQLAQPRSSADARSSACSRCVSLALVTVYFRESDGGVLHGAQSTGATVLRPFEVGAERVARPFRDGAGWFGGLLHAKSDNKKLKRQVDAPPPAARSSTSRALRENAQLKKLLDYLEGPRFPQDYQPVVGARDRAGAEPVRRSRSSSPPARTTAIAKHDAVVTADGPRRRGDEGREQRRAGDAAHRRLERRLRPRHPARTPTGIVQHDAVGLDADPRPGDEGPGRRPRRRDRRPRAGARAT